jgi:NAD(P)H-nitrite reductase large subunit
MKYDVRRREYDVIVIGEEPHLAYNRVGLTSFFQHREVENLYLNPKEWVSVALQIRKMEVDHVTVLIDAGRLAELPSQHHGYRDKL